MSRIYSKTKAIAGHVTWTDQEVIPVAITLPGTPDAGRLFGALKIAGRAMFLKGICFDLQRPSLTRDTSVIVAFADGDGNTVGETLSISGSHGHSELTYSSPIGLPSGSYWQCRVGSSAGVPGTDLTVTYLLTYANEPVLNSGAVFTLNQTGIGFWTVNRDFQILNTL